MSDCVQGGFMGDCMYVRVEGCMGDCVLENGRMHG